MQAELEIAISPFGLGKDLQQFDNMRLDCLRGLCVFLVLTVPALQLNWQGSGNMSESNMTEIHTAITNTPISSLTTNLETDEIARAISTRLTTLWDPAWNVVITKSPANYNTILYGYAFRNHWMWINGVPIPGDTTMFLAYVIWKDYNCHTWTTLTTMFNSVITFPTDLQVQLLLKQFTGVKDDIWKTAFDFVEFLNSKPQLRNGAYTVIMSQLKQASFNGYICLVNTNFVFRSGMENSQSGSFLMFQTRQKQ